VQPDPANKKLGGHAQRMMLATDLPFAFAGPIVLGGFLGYLLDARAGTKPLFTLALGALGFYAGLRALFHRLKMLDQEKRDNVPPRA
jgi:F0F1-type ATP synthase assembly protein I